MDCCQPQDKNCLCKTDCCRGVEQNRSESGSKIVIDFLYLDLSVCGRCQGADAGLIEAVEEVAQILELTGAEIIINKVHVDSQEKAIQHQFVTSPTIRVNGKDIQMEFRESLCESCGDLCGSEVDCRVWVYKGKEYNIPPKGMIVEAILKEVYGGTNTLPEGGVSREAYQLPKNLKRFFKSI
jgi:O-phosphoseryl-tRNA(Cys) synthetase